MVEVMPMTRKMSRAWPMLPVVNKSSPSSSLSHEYERVQQEELFFRSHPHCSWTQSPHLILSCPEYWKLGQEMLYARLYDE